MKQIFSFLWKYCKWEKKAFWMVILPMLGAFILSPLAPLFYKEFIDLISADVSEDILVSQLWRAAWWYFIFIVLVQIFWKTLEYWLIPLESSIAKKIYHDSFAHILTQSHRFFSGKPSGSIIRMISRLADTTWQFIDTLIFQVLRFIFNIVVILIVLWMQNPYLGLFFSVWMVALALIKWKLWRNNFALNTSVSVASTKISGQISDVFTNAFTVLTCGTQVKEFRTFGLVVSEWTVLQRKMWWQEYRIFFTTTFFILILQICSISGLIYLWSEDLITTGIFTLTIIYMWVFIDQAININHIFRGMYRQGADMVEAIGLLSEWAEIRDISSALPLQIQKGEIRFDHISFSYHSEGEAILKNFSLTISPGEKVALVWVSGSGKSTLLKLLFRLYDLDEGIISIDGQNISQVTQESLRQSMSIVPQEPVLFHRSIAENIAYASGQTDWPNLFEIERAAKLAHAHEFIRALPDGYETLVGERGVKLSWWERQRIALARAILANKSLLVLDEATSALDSMSEKYIQDSLHEVMKGRTSIVIAHRLSTIKQMDRIVVMDKGEIIEEGTHEELIGDKKSAYKKLWDIQTGDMIVDA